MSIALLFAAFLCLLAATAEDAKSSFPGSPGVIALQRSADPDASAIWVLDPRTGYARQLTFRGFNREPTFSPDGKSIAFISDLPKSYFNIWTIRADGTGMRRVTRGLGEVGAEAPTFNANGRWIAFSAETRAGGREIDRVSSSGGHRRLLVAQRGKTSAYEPAYSPDGRHLAWVAFRESRGALPQIFIGNSNGRGGHRVTQGNEPEFSPNGQNIVFVRFGRCTDGRPGSAVETLSLGTGELHQVAAACGAELAEPTYSPDDGWIAYTRYSGERSELAFSPVLGVPSAVTPLPGLGTDLPVDAEPSWQPAS